MNRRVGMAGSKFQDSGFIYRLSEDLKWMTYFALIDTVFVPSVRVMALNYSSNLPN